MEAVCGNDPCILPFVAIAIIIPAVIGYFAWKNKAGNKA
jgi:hypothetical protein